MMINMDSGEWILFKLADILTALTDYDIDKDNSNNGILIILDKQLQELLNIKPLYGKIKMTIKGKEWYFDYKVNFDNPRVLYKLKHIGTIQSLPLV